MAGKITPRKQDDLKATFTREIKKTDGFIPSKYLDKAMTGSHTVKSNWEINFMKDFAIHPSPIVIHRFIRAMQPWPGAWTEIKLMVNGLWIKKRLKILKTHLQTESATSHQSLIIDEVQLEGKNPVSWRQFKEGYEFKLE
jgi:methionyl-tRNA formyltransferase